MENIQRVPEFLNDYLYKPVLTRKFIRTRYRMVNTPKPVEKAAIRNKRRRVNRRNSVGVCVE